MALTEQSQNNASDSLTGASQVNIPAGVARNEDEITRPLQLNSTTPIIIQSIGPLPDQAPARPPKLTPLALENAIAEVSAEEDTQKVFLFPPVEEQSAPELPAPPVTPEGAASVPAWLLAYVQAENFYPDNAPPKTDSDTSPILVRPDSEAKAFSEETAVVTATASGEAQSEWTSEKEQPLEGQEDPNSSVLLAIGKALSNADFHAAADMIQQHSSDPSLRAEAVKLIRPYLSLDEDRQILWDLNSEIDQLDQQT